jgi:hypothetical protein
MNSSAQQQHRTEYSKNGVVNGGRNHHAQPLKMNQTATQLSTGKQNEQEIQTEYPKQTTKPKATTLAPIWTEVVWRTVAARHTTNK